MGGEGNREAALLGNVFGDDRGGYFVHLEAAVLLGNIDGGQAEARGFFEKTARHGEVFGFDLVGRRHDLVDGEVRCGLGDLLVLVGEVFGEEAIGGGGVGDEEAAAWNPFLFGRDWRSHCGHDVTPAN